MAAPSRKRARSTWLAPMLSAGFGAGASALGYAGLSPYASGFGSYLGQKFKDITGYGAYTVRKNVLAGEVPSVGNSSNVEGGLLISHREYLGDIITSHYAGAFSSISFRINPGSSQTWEWLAQIACNYEQWVPEGILFCFKSTSSDSLNSTNTALGSVIMATQYDLYAPPFTTKAEMMAYEYSSSGLPSEDIIHPVECDPRQIPVSVLDVSNSPTSPGDHRFADLGIFTIATSGFQGIDVVVGELWVTYQVTLLKPKLYASLGKFNDFFHAYVPQSSYGQSPYQVGFQPLVVDVANTIPIYPYSTGLYYDDTSLSGYRFYGDRSQPGLCLQMHNAGASYDSLSIFFPLYAYPVAYMIYWWCNYASDESGILPTVTTGSDYGNAPVAFGDLFSPDSSDSTDLHTVMTKVYIPGQKIAPYDGARNKPYLTFRLSNGNMEDYEFLIVQIPSNCTQGAL